METTIELRNLTEEELDAVAAADRNLYYEELGTTGSRPTSASMCRL